MMIQRLSFTTNLFLGELAKRKLWKGMNLQKFC